MRTSAPVRRRLPLGFDEDVRIIRKALDEADDRSTGEDGFEDR